MKKIKKLLKSSSKEDVILGLHALKQYKGWFKALLFFEILMSIALPFTMLAIIVLNENTKGKRTKFISSYEYLIFRYSANSRYICCDYDSMHVFDPQSSALILHPTFFGAFICAIITKYRTSREKRQPLSIFSDYV